MVNSQIESPDQYIALYHSGVKAAASLPEWFARKHPKYPDHACIRVKVVSVFKKQDDIPFGLIGHCSPE